MNKSECSEFEYALFKYYNAYRLAMSESEYREFIRVAKDRAMPVTPPTPHSCAGCFHLEPSGLCGYFNEYPPAQFIEKVNECEHWEEDLPF